MNHQNLVQSLEPRRLLAAFAFVDGNGVLQIKGTAGADSIVILRSGTHVKVKINSSAAAFDSADVRAISVDARAADDTIEKHVGLPATLIGGKGNDTLIGGPGPDYFRDAGGENSFQLSGSDDVIDFSDRSSVNLSTDQENSLGIGISDGAAHDIIASKDPFRILGSSGDDSIEIDVEFGAAGPVTVDGSGGNDQIFIDKYGLDDLEDEKVSVNGGSGNDTIRIDSDAPSTTTVKGGSGNDQILIGQTAVAADSSLVHGGSGRDTLDLTAFDIDSIPFTAYRVLPDFEAFVGPPDNIDDLTELAVPYEVIANNLGDDIRISSRDTTVRGGAGNDRIQAAINPADTVESDPGSDIFYGGGGNDTLIGFANDTMYGSDGNDSLVAGEGKNLLLGGAGNDTLQGGPGNDTIHGGPGRDKLYGEDGNDVIYAKDGRTDTLDGGAGFDTAQRDNSATIKDQVLNIEKFI